MMRLTKEDLTVLRNRFSVMKHRAKAMDIPCAWTTCDEFLCDLEAVAPKIYSPKTHRVVYEPGELKPDGKGYCRQTMRIQYSMAKSVDKSGLGTKVQKKSVGMRLEDLGIQLSIRFSTPSYDGSPKAILSDCLLAMAD